MESLSPIAVHYSENPDAQRAAAELAAGIADGADEDDFAVILFFCCCADYQLDELASHLSQSFPKAELVGCTTAGNIGPAGYSDHGIVAVALPRTSFCVVTTAIDDLQNVDLARCNHVAGELFASLRTACPAASPDNTFAMLLIDGLSLSEELVASAIHTNLNGMPMFGGSAGDQLSLRETYVYHTGTFRRDRAVVMLCSTALPFRVFKTQSFVSSQRKLVVTEADPETRTARGLNGAPAADEYARLIGSSRADLSPSVFSSHPLVVRIAGHDYIRAIQRANADGSLTFHSAMEEGLVVSLAQEVDLVNDLRSTLDEIRSAIGPPQALLACDCVQRRITVQEKGLDEQVTGLMVANNAVGLNTYGEQYQGIHVNVTLTGVAIGRLPVGRSD